MDYRNAKTTLRYKKKKTLNIWILVSVLVFIYLVVYLFFYFFNTKVSFTEVTDGVTSGKFETQYTALVMRDETEVDVVDSGYINFFVGDGSQIYVGENTYLLDKKGDISSRLEDASKSYAILNGNDLSKIKDSIYDFDTAFNTEHYYDAYSFKYKLESQVLDLINSSVFNDTLNELDNNSSDYSIVQSTKSGIVMHNVDGFENLTYKDVESNFFKRANYKKTLIKSNDYLEKGDPVYKVITDDEWNLIFQIMDPHDFEGVKSLDIEFLKDNIKTTCDFTTYVKSGNTYGVLTLNKYMIRYISDRYLQIRLYENYHEGLKVPKTAVEEKQFYAIPYEYMTQGGNSNSYGFLLQDGTKAEFITPVIMMSDDENVYVSVDDGLLHDNDVLIKNNSTDTYKVMKKENRQGVYAIENGYAHFKLVDILGENNNYYIISDKTRNGVQLFDQVIEDYHAANEGQEVY